jgi:hypothetical protein
MEEAANVIFTSEPDDKHSWGQRSAEVNAVMPFAP